LAYSQGTAVGSVNRFRKNVDFVQGGTGSLDFERTVRSIGVIDDGNGNVIAQPVFLVDPGQSGFAPVKSATILPTGVNITNISTAALGVFLVRVADQAGSLSMLEDKNYLYSRTVSATNTAVTTTFDIRACKNKMAIHVDATGGTATLKVSGSVDNTNFIEVDSLAAAAFQDKQYTDSTVGADASAAAAGPLSPLAFRYVKIVTGAAGVGITTTTTTSIK
jgi:hypothetical protein